MRGDISQSTHGMISTSHQLLDRLVGGARWPPPPPGRGGGSKHGRADRVGLLTPHSSGRPSLPPLACPPSTTAGELGAGTLPPVVAPPRGGGGLAAAARQLLAPLLPPPPAPRCSCRHRAHGKDGAGDDRQRGGRTRKPAATPPPRGRRHFCGAQQPHSGREPEVTNNGKAGGGGVAPPPTDSPPLRSGHASPNPPVTRAPQPLANEQL